MTPEQYERWKDFSFRMVNMAVSSRKKSPSREKVKEDIAFFFECRMDPDEEWRRVRDWDYTEDNPDEHWQAMSVGSHIHDLDEHFIPAYWSLPDTDAAYDQARARWCDPVACCIRAGLDVAVSPSGGVLGFTAGDIRKMYPDGVPDWVKAYFSEGELIGVDAVIPGVGLVPSEPIADSRTFDELPDDQEVWL